MAEELGGQGGADGDGGDVLTEVYPPLCALLGGGKGVRALLPVEPSLQRLVGSIFHAFSGCAKCLTIPCAILAGPSKSCLSL